MGKSTTIGGKYAHIALQYAVDDLKVGKIDALVTQPINKHNIQSDKFPYAGHTEYLQKEFEAKESLMLLIADQMRVGVVTGHIPVADVAKQVTIEKILSKLRTMNQSLQTDFGINRPKIAVLGINPHAGDEGTIGKEELTVIKPAIAKANDEGILAFGTFAADGFFAAQHYKKFDAVLAMYHDQGLIPFKALCFETGVNYTAGLPIVRTSPDHGTAYDLVGKGTATLEPFRQAIYQAIRIHKTRHENIALHANTLKKTVLASEGDNV
jgi:4-hydroxythreonine-4-phosphate dehydrogenase